LITAAVIDLDAGKGALLRDIAAYPHADTARLVRDAKALESGGHVICKTSLSRAGDTLLALSATAKAQVSPYEQALEASREEMFGNADGTVLNALQTQLAAIDERLLAMIRKLATDAKSSIGNANRSR
jgi:hypothetical protein